MWIRDYPHDFAVGAAADALNALVKSIVTKTHLLHYGSDLLPFLEGRPLQDKDFAWAMKVDEPTAESDESYSLSEDDDDVVPPLGVASSQTRSFSLTEETSSTQSPVPSSRRERKSSLPLSARSNGVMATDHADGVKEILKNLLSTSAKLNGCEPLHVAEEITRVGKSLFLLIKVGIIFNLQYPRPITFWLFSSHATGCNMCWFLERRTQRPTRLRVSVRCPSIWQIGTCMIITALSRLD